jgi:hypothetical protein
MDEASFAEVYKSKQLQRFLWAAARRYFGKDEDLQKDAVAEAWQRIFAQAAAGLDLDQYKRQGALAIIAMYRRVSNRRKKELAADLDEPGAALHALARKAIDGDW